MQYENEIYPSGELHEYKNDTLSRITNEEKKEIERQKKDDYNNIRKAAEVHRQVNFIIEFKG